MQQKSGQQQKERISHFCIAVLIVYKKKFSYYNAIGLILQMLTFYLLAIASVYTCQRIYFITAVFACLQKDGIIDESCRDAADTKKLGAKQVFEICVVAWL